MTPPTEHSSPDQPHRDDERDGPATPADEPVGDLRGGEQSDPGGDSDADVSSEG